jgi:hypothetical protein
MANHYIHTRRFLSCLLGLDLFYLPHLLTPSQRHPPHSPHLPSHRLLHSGGNIFPPCCRQPSYSGQIANCGCPRYSSIWSFDPHTDLLSKTGGAFTFALSLCVWYLLLVQMLEAVDFPINLPVGDLSTIVPGRSIKAPKKHEHED